MMTELRHLPDGRLELSLLPVPARGRPARCRSTSTPGSSASATRMSRTSSVTRGRRCRPWCRAWVARTIGPGASASTAEPAVASSWRSGQPAGRSDQPDAALLRAGPRLPDGAIVCSDSGSSANCSPAICGSRGMMASSCPGPSPPWVRESPTGSARSSAIRSARHRLRRRRRDADERPRRADHDRAVLARVGGSSAGHRRPAQRRPEPGHLGDARDGGRPEVRRVPDPARRRLCRLRRQSGIAGVPVVKPDDRSGLGPRAGRRPAHACSTSAADPNVPPIPPHATFEQARMRPKRCWRATRTAGA